MENSKPMEEPGSSQKIFTLERPDPALLRLYIIRSLLTGPFFLVLMPLLFFRYRTLRYRFDDEGIHMRVGILFRKEVNLTYARIQDIHLNSGVIQRYLGLADIQIQTASGASGAELVIEGFKEFDEIRDFLYTRMRGARDRRAQNTGTEIPAAPITGDGESDGEVVSLLLNIRDELRQTRELLEDRGRGGGPP